MSEDRQPQPRDRVHVAFDAEYHGTAGGDLDLPHRVQVMKGGHRCLISLPDDAKLVVLESADDPSKDPVGTRRTTGSRRALVRRGGGHANPWLDLVSDEVFPDRSVVGWDILEPVPGTPAAEQQQDETPLPEWEMELLEQEAARRSGPRPGPRVPRSPKPAREPRVFRSDGPEPPPDVTVLEPVQPQLGWSRIERDGDCWRWANDSGRALGARPWTGLYHRPAEFREVLP